jgi:hypothetical protein
MFPEPGALPSPLLIVSAAAPSSAIRAGDQSVLFAGVRPFHASRARVLDAGSAVALYQAARRVDSPSPAAAHPPISDLFGGMSTKL